MSQPTPCLLFGGSDLLGGLVGSDLLGGLVGSDLLGGLVGNDLLGVLVGNGLLGLLGGSGLLGDLDVRIFSVISLAMTVVRALRCLFESDFLGVIFDRI